MNTEEISLINVLPCGFIEGIVTCVFGTIFGQFLYNHTMLIKNYETVVTRFFDDYAHYTHTLQVDKPHYEPSTTHLTLLFGKEKPEIAKLFNKDNSEWWTRYSILFTEYNKGIHRQNISDLCDTCKVHDLRKFIAWVSKQAERERSKRKNKAITHNKTLDIYSGYKLEYPNIDYFEFMA